MTTGDGPVYAAFFGDLRGNVYAVNAATGALIWTVKADAHPLARVVGSVVFHDGRLYVPVASAEETAGAPADYECCRFRGSVSALDAATGRQIWKTYTIAEEARPTKKNAVGTQLWGPSGAGVWSSPAIDVRAQRSVCDHGRQLQRAGLEHERLVRRHGPRHGEDSLVEADDGRRRVEHGVPPAGQDELSRHGGARLRLLVAADPRDARRTAGARSSPDRSPAWCTRVDPDEQGKILWQERVGTGGTLGGVQWGSAADGANVYVALSDIVRTFIPNSLGTNVDPKTGGGMFAFNLADRRTHVVHAAARLRHAPALQPGAVGRGQRDSGRRVLGIGRRPPARLLDDRTARSSGTSTASARTRPSTKCPRAADRSTDPGPAIAGGMLFVNSGYARAGGMPGNVLLAFSVDGQ